MQVKNLTKTDMTFMFTSKLSTAEVPLFGTVNIVAGWTVIVDNEIWAEICHQTKTVNIMTTELVDIEGATMKDMNGKGYTPKRTVTYLDGTKEVNLVQSLIKDYHIEVIDLENIKVTLPQRSILESFLKRNNEAFTAKETDEELAAKVSAIKAELKALETL